MGLLRSTGSQLDQMGDAVDQMGTLVGEFADTSIELLSQKARAELQEVILQGLLAHRLMNAHSPLSGTDIVEQAESLDARLRALDLDDVGLDVYALIGRTQSELRETLAGFSDARLRSFGGLLCDRLDPSRSIRDAADGVLVGREETRLAHQWGSSLDPELVIA